MSWLQGWGPLLRIARRDALRARGRSALVLVMIALPVLGVTATAVAYQTSSVTGAEALERTIGAADAGIRVEPGATKVLQAFDPMVFQTGAYDEDVPAASLDDIERVLGRDVPAVERHEGEIRFATDRGVGTADVTETDLREPLSVGQFELTGGRLPERADEVVVNAALAERGPGIGERLEVEDGNTLDIVGTVESAAVRGYPRAVALLGAFGEDKTNPAPTYLVGGGPVSWDEVRALNDIGASVTSRAVLTDPPPDSELAADVPRSGGLEDGTLAVLVLVVSMALLEVVLLAGPAFAVTARRQARTIALMVASGGTPSQARRLVLATGVVLGALASVAGVLIGLGGAAVLVPVLQGFSDGVFGPYEVPWLTVAGVAGFGLLSAVLAAVVPAWIASRQDVVAVLAGRRGDRGPSTRSPVVGAVLLGLGVALAAYGAVSGGGETLIGAAAVVSVLGMILFVPVVLAGLARVSRRLPLAGRYAVRDAARHRTRTVPAVAAVAATVAGVVTLGIAGSSDQAEARETYQATLPTGVGVLTDYEPDTDWATLRGIVERSQPGAVVTDLAGVSDAYDPDAESYRFPTVTVPGTDELPLATYGSTVGTLVVSDGDLPAGLDLVPAERRAAAEAVLARGGMVAFADQPSDADSADILVEESSSDTGEVIGRERVSVPALWVAPTRSSTPMAVLSTSAAEQAGLPVETTALVVTGDPVTADRQTDIDEELAAVSPSAGLYVERGFEQDQMWVVILLILGGLAGVLMLGGTLTATFLGLSDARPDLATLAAIGASPRERRGVAASFALVVGFVGAVLGAVVGFIPGVAITYPLTVIPGDVATGAAGYVSSTGVQSGPYLDIPWLLILGLVVALPLLTAVIVWLTTRARLPLVARLD